MAELSIKFYLFRAVIVVC